MKSYVLALLLMLALPNVLFASTYGKPYGADDATEVEQADVKSIDEINRTTEIEEPEAPVVQDDVQTKEPKVSDSVSPDDSMPEEKELTPPEQLETPAQ